MSQDLLLVDVIPLSIGVENEHGTVDRFFNRNTPIPATKTMSDTTVENNQDAIQFKIYEGERPKAKDCHKLGSFLLEGILPAKAGVPDIETTISIDANGILNVKAVDKGTGKSSGVTISNEKGRLSEAQIEKLIRDSEKFADQDKEFAAKMDARDAMKQYLHSLTEMLDGAADEKISSEDKEAISEALKDGKSWLKSNKDASADEVQEKKKEIEEICAPIIEGFYGSKSGGGDDDEDDGEL